MNTKIKNKKNKKEIPFITAYGVMKWGYELIKAYHTKKENRNIRKNSSNYIDGATKSFVLESIRLGLVHILLVEEYENIAEGGFSMLDNAISSGEIKEPENYGMIAKMEYAKENIKNPVWFDMAILENLTKD